MVLTVSFALLCDRALLPPSPGGCVLSEPGRADSTPPNLTPASGRQDHMTSPYATSSLVRVLLIAHGFKEPALQSRRAQNAAASTASLPNVRDDRETPLCSGGTAESIKVFLASCEVEYFCKADWTAKAVICPSGKIDA